MKPLGYYAASLLREPDADVLDRIQEQFGAQLETLTLDDKASLLICLIEAAVNPQQVLTEPNFFSSQNGGQAWQLAQELSPDNQIALSVALVNQIAYGGQ